MADSFAPYPVEMWLEVNSTYEVLLKFDIKSVADAENLLRFKSQRSRNGAKSAPFRSGPLTKVEMAQSAPFAPLDRRDNGSTLVSATARGAKRSDPQTQKMELELELSDLKEWIVETAKEVAAFDLALAPVWARENRIRAAIKSTHGVNSSGTLIYSRAGACDRAPCFEDLMAISLEWGHTKSKRTELAQRVRAYERVADRIGRELERLVKKGKRHA
jgi:hypothetical protein